MLFTQNERDDNESRQYPGRQRSLGADNMRDLAYLKLLSREYPNIRAAASDIINLQAICGLPKGTGSEELQVGQQVYLTNQMGQPFPVKVIAKDEVNITFDANHEMAGKELNFKIELVEVK